MSVRIFAGHLWATGDANFRHTPTHHTRPHINKMHYVHTFSRAHYITFFTLPNTFSLYIACICVHNWNAQKHYLKANGKNYSNPSNQIRFFLSLQTNNSVDISMIFFWFPAVLLSKAPNVIKTTIFKTNCTDSHLKLKWAFDKENEDTT